MRARSTVVALLFALIVSMPSPARAGHHLWRLTQAFSNASGSVQFLQLFVNEDGEAGVGPFTVTASGHTFNFVTNLPSTSTANTWILIATSGFGSLPGGVTPDYILPASFFSTGGGTINYAGIDAWTYGVVPTDGVHSLMRDGTTPANSPKNFAGQSGSVNLATSVPAASTAMIVALIGALLLAGSGLLRKQAITRA
jgi:serralysin